MTDIIEEGGVCRGVVMQEQDGTSRAVRSAYTIVASGGIGGLYRHSTNFPHLTGDALEIAKNTESDWNIPIMFRFIRQRFILRSRGGDF